MWRQAIISLGSNIAPRHERLAAAREALRAVPGIRGVVCSSIVETEPVDVPAPFQDCLFLNQIMVCETELEPYALLHALQAIETRLGRVRGPVRNVPRTIDLDLIALGDVVMNELALTLPHPRARERAFVLGPLAEILPGFVWPDTRRMDV